MDAQDRYSLGGGSSQYRVGRGFSSTCIHHAIRRANKQMIAVAIQKKGLENMTNIVERLRWSISADTRWAALRGGLSYFDA